MKNGGNDSPVFKKVAWMGAGVLSLLVLGAAVLLAFEAPPGPVPEASASKAKYVSSRSRRSRYMSPRNARTARKPRPAVMRPAHMLPKPPVRKGERRGPTTVTDRRAKTISRPELARPKLGLDRLKRPALKANRRPGRLSKEELDKRREERRKRQVERLRKRIKTLEDRIENYRQDGTRTEAQISRMERSLDRMKKRLKRMEDEQQR